MPTLVLLRHGQSQWNLENRFTGWWDVGLTERGIEEAKAAGALLRDKGFDFDHCFTSLQSRAIRTLDLVLEAMDRWVRTLAATLATGRSVTDAIRVSRKTAPAAVAEEVEVLVLRLNSRWETRTALQRFADALDSPDTDAVVAALMLAAGRGAAGASATVHALAESIQAQLRARRVIEVERSKPYVVVRQVTVITLVTLGGMFLLRPEFFAGYRTPVGQVVLVQTDHDRDASGPAADKEHVGQGEGRPAAGRGGAERPAANGSLIRGRAAVAGGFGV